MTELKAHLRPYKLEEALSADCTGRARCFVLDVGHHKDNSVASLAQVTESVNNYTMSAYDRLEPVTKLYIVGDWKFASHKKVDGGDEQGHEEQKRYVNEVRRQTKAQ